MRPCNPRVWLLGILLPMLLGVDWNPGAASWDRHFPPGVENTTTPVPTLPFDYVHVRPSLSDDAEVWRMKELRDFMVDPHTTRDRVWHVGPTDRTVLVATPRGLYVSYIHRMIVWGPSLVDRWREVVAVLLLIGMGVLLYKLIRRYRLAAILRAQWWGIPPGERYCRGCYYLLRGTDGANCPECGAPTDGSVVAPQLAPLEMRRLWRGVVITGVLLISLSVLPFLPAQLPFRMKLAYEVDKHLDREQNVELLDQNSSFYEFVAATSLIHVDPDTGAERVVCREFINNWYGDEVGYIPRSDGDTFVRVSRQGIELRDTKTGGHLRTIAHAMPGLGAMWMQRRRVPQSLYPIGGDPTVQYHFDPESLEIYTLPDQHQGAPSFLHAGNTRLLVDGESVYHLRYGNAPHHPDKEPVLPPTPPSGDLARIATAALSPDGRRLYIAWVHVAKFPPTYVYDGVRQSFPGIVQVWDLVEHREIAQVRVLDGISFMDPYFLAVADDEKSFDLGLAEWRVQEVYTYDLAAGRVTRAMIGQGNPMQTAKDPTSDRYFIAESTMLNNGPNVMRITVAKYEAENRAGEKPVGDANHLAPRQ